LTGPKGVFAGTQPSFTDLRVPPIPRLFTLAVGSRNGGPEAEMVGERQATATGNGWWAGAFWIAGAATFMMELNAGLDYVQSQLAALVPNFMGCLPALGLAACRLAESIFWNCAQLESTFRTMPFVTLPFFLVGLGMSMRQKPGPGWQQSEQR
jgi:hypothetical protein